VARPHNAIAELTEFVLNAPGALGRRAFGSRFVRSHPELASSVPVPQASPIIRRLREELPSLRIQTYRADPVRFRAWVEEARYPFWHYPFKSSRFEKYLEHQVSVDLLDPIAGGTLVDVACGGSYFGAIMQRRGFRTIDQDLAFPTGLHGDRLGGNAAAMELPDESVDGMTLHCSFEHFEGDSDTRFVAECARVLRPGGATVILPLYLNERQMVVTDPYYFARGLTPMDDGAEPVMLVGYSNRHGRHYDASSLKSRVVDPAIAAGLETTVTVIENTEAISPTCYLRFALTLKKKRPTK